MKALGYLTVEEPFKTNSDENCIKASKHEDGAEIGRGEAIIVLLLLVVVEIILVVVS